jgi:hypothetical protein
MVLRMNEQSNKVEPDISNLRAKMVAISVVDEEGRRVFTNEDVEALSRKHHEAIRFLFNKAMSLNRIEEEAVEGEPRVDVVDEEAKN